MSDTTHAEDVADTSPVPLIPEQARDLPASQLGWRKSLLLLAVILPSRLKIEVYRRLLRWKIGEGVHIGLSYLDGDCVQIGDHTRIGHFNVFRELRRFKVGSHCYLANFNQVFGARFYGGHYTSVFEVGDGVNFMSHHFVDVAGTVSIGDKTTIGGRDTHFWSHSVYLRDGARVMEPTRLQIGSDVYVGARATLVGCSIPDGAVVGAGSVVTKCFPSEDCRLLIAGNPAIIKKHYNGDRIDA